MKIEHVTSTMSERTTSKLLGVDTSDIVACRTTAKYRLMLTTAMLYPFASVALGLSIYRACAFMNLEAPLTVSLSIIVTFVILCLQRTFFADAFYGDRQRYMTRAIAPCGLLMVGILSGAHYFEADIAHQRSLLINAAYVDLLKKDKTINVLRSERETVVNSLNNVNQDIFDIKKSINNEILGVIGSHLRGNGPIAQELNYSLEHLNQESSQAKKQLASVNTQIAIFETTLRKNATESILRDHDPLNVALKVAFGNTYNAIIFLMLLTLPLYTTMLTVDFSRACFQQPITKA
jgi:hypothetical protein